MNWKVKSLIAVALIGCGVVFSELPSQAQKIANQINGEKDTNQTDITKSSESPAVTISYTGPPVAVPDNVPAGVNINIPVSGVTGNITDLNFTFDTGGACDAIVNNLNAGMNHTWVGDLAFKLTSPNGTTVTFIDRIGVPASAAGFNGNNFCAATIDDAAATPIEGVTVEPVAGTFSPNNPLAVFNGQSANGNWVLNVSDNAGIDTGSMQRFSLVISAGIPINDVPADFNGDGKTDFVVARATNAPIAPEVSNTDGETGTLFRNPDGSRKEFSLTPDSPAAEIPLYWYVSMNGSAVTQGAQWGRVNDVATSPSTNDVALTEDGDGDGKDDYVIWRPSIIPGQSAFYYLQSNGTVRVERFGEPGDDPTIIGDYDGDGKADSAIYRTSNSTFYYRGTLNNISGNTTFVKWGTPSVDFPYPGDFDGDGKHDICVHQGSGNFFILLKSSGGTEWIPWGTGTDFYIPGDYDFDGKTDFCVRRAETIGGNAGRSYYILERDGGGTGGSPIRFGQAGDTTAQGDYDGDGRTDIGSWRSTGPSATFFYVRDSATGALTTLEWGTTGDFAVAGYNVH
jgi:subtilisin-like proprotein convertase family protein